MVDTITQYRSPVRLVLHAAEAISPYSPQAISRARKKMMAEIALGGDEVVLDDVAYSRNDAATLLDDISEETWRVHCLIYTYPGLLAFLEKQEFNQEELGKADAYLYDQRFVKVVSPWFAYSFHAVSGALLRQDNFDGLVQLLRFKGYILPEHQHEAFQKIRNYLDELSYTLRNLSWEKFIADESVLHFVFDENWQQFLNALPPSFNTQRDEIVDHLIQIVLRFQQKATWYYLHQVLLNLRSLDTNDFNKHEITRIDAVIYENVQLESKGKLKKDGEFSSGRFIWWGIWIVLMIVRAATCNDRSSKSYDYNRYTYEPVINTKIYSSEEQQNERFFLQSLDSLYEAKRSVNPKYIKTGDQPFAYLGDDPSTARNDSFLISNKTGYDAVFLYFKDVPNHGRSGTLPKLYSTFIKNGDTEKLFVQPENGRVYLAFGKGWGELKTPVTIALPYGAKGVDSITLTEFFSSGKDADRSYLYHPLYIEYSYQIRDEDNYIYHNTGRADSDQMTGLVLTLVSGRITVQANGRLAIKEDRVPVNFAAPAIEPPANGKQ